MERERSSADFGPGTRCFSKCTEGGGNEFHIVKCAFKRKILLHFGIVKQNLLDSYIFRGWADLTWWNSKRSS